MRKGFTLLELIVVIIIIGVLASLALPQYFKVTEKARAAEGVVLLSLLRGSQIRYYAEKAAYTAAIGDLDAAYTTPRYFTIAAPLATAAEVAKVVRSTVQAGYGQYGLSITEAGVVTCSVGGVAGACTAIGY